MENELRNILNQIRADDALKQRTEEFLNSKLETRKPTISQTALRRRLAAACSVLLMLVVASGASLKLFFTPVAYIDIDVNPSIGLVVNRFDRVIDFHAYNDAGTAILDAVSIRYYKYDDATQLLLEEIFDMGYLTEDGLVSITVQSGITDREPVMLDCLTSRTTTSLSDSFSGAQTAQTEIYSVSSDTRVSAQEHRISPAHYLAICELQAVDPTATFQACEHMTVTEIRERTRCHNEENHGEGANPEHEPYNNDHDNQEHDNCNNGNHNQPNDHDDNEHSPTAPSQPDQHNNDHHNNGGGNHH